MGTERDKQEGKGGDAPHFPAFPSHMKSWKRLHFSHVYMFTIKYLTDHLYTAAFN